MQAFIQQYGQTIGFVFLAVILLRMAVDFSQLFGWLRAGLAALTSRMPGTLQGVDREAEALQATRYLIKYFGEIKCRAGLAAAKTCGQHLLDHGDDTPATGA